MTETMTEKQTSAFDELMALLDKLEKAKQTAYKEVVAATKAQKEAQNAWHVNSSQGLQKKAQI